MLVDTIELEGNPYPICFPTAAFAEFERQTDSTAVDLLAQFETGMVNFTHLCVLVAAGLNSGARKTSTGKKFTAEDAGDMFGLMDIPKITPILKKYLVAETDTETEKNDQGATIPEA